MLRFFKTSGDQSIFCHIEKKRKGKVMCLVCHAFISVLKEYNTKRLYDYKHKVKYDVLNGKLREIEA